MISKLLKGEYAAVISDDTQLIGRAFADQTCSLHILGDMIEPFDLAVAFRRGFPSDAFRAAVSSALLDLQESGVLTVRSPLCCAAAVHRPVPRQACCRPGSASGLSAAVQFCHNDSRDSSVIRFESTVVLRWNAA